MKTAVDGAIRGVVRDAGGAIVPDARVRVDDDASGVHLVSVTRRNGEFVLLRVPAGVYGMTVDASGLRRLVRQVNVELGGMAEVDVRLGLPGVSTVVTVMGEEESAATALTSSVTPHEIERLPVNGRRWQTFALLAPGVNSSGTDDLLLSFRGAAVTQNSYSIDGGSDDRVLGRYLGVRRWMILRKKRLQEGRARRGAAEMQLPEGMGVTRERRIRFHRRRCGSFG